LHNCSPSRGQSEDISLLGDNAGNNHTYTHWGKNSAKHNKDKISKLINENECSKDMSAVVVVD